MEYSGPYAFRIGGGRHFTDYRPRDVVNELLRVQNGIHSNYDYRMFLTQNAQQVMDQARREAEMRNNVNPETRK